jgi:hypothetical protein
VGAGRERKGRHPRCDLRCEVWELRWYDVTWSIGRGIRGRGAASLPCMRRDETRRLEGGGEGAGDWLVEGQGQGEHGSWCTMHETRDLTSAGVRWLALG